MRTCRWLRVGSDGQKRRGHGERRSPVALFIGGGAPVVLGGQGRAEKDQCRVGKAMGYLDWRKWGRRDGLHARRRYWGSPATMALGGGFWAVSVRKGGDDWSGRL